MEEILKKLMKHNIDMRVDTTFVSVGNMVIISLQKGVMGYQFSINGDDLNNPNMDAAYILGVNVDAFIKEHCGDEVEDIAEAVFSAV